MAYNNRVIRVCLFATVHTLIAHAIVTTQSDNNGIACLRHCRIQPFQWLYL